MQNVLKRKNVYSEGFQVILYFFPQNHMIYIEHSKSFHMHIEILLKKKKLSESVFALRVRGGQKVSDMSTSRNRFFLRLP